jgi:soluble lytic murein transglycosylase
VSSMQKRALLLVPVIASVAAAAAVAPRARLQPTPAPAPAAAAPQFQTAAAATQTQPAFTPSPIASAVAHWHALRQSDRLPFASYASFLTRYRGWPGESGLRRSAEGTIGPSDAPALVTNYFRQHPPLTATGHARHAFALMASGQIAAAQAAARAAWHGGALARADEDRILAQFGTSLLAADHDLRMERLLSDGDTTSAFRALAYASPGRRPVYEARLAMQSRAPDAAAKLGLIGASADNDPGVLMDRAKWLRNTSQSGAARSLLARPRTLASKPIDAEQWFETLLTMARGAANDRQWSLAYQIASQVDDAYAPGTDISLRPEGERDDYTSLVWLAGTTAMHRLGRPADAAAMFSRYARGGQSAQVLTKGLYWAGRAAQAAGNTALASSAFSEASHFPELFYGQLALERVARPVPTPPSMVVIIPPTPAERAAFQRRDLVEAVRYLGMVGRWEDQSLFIRALADHVKTDRERALAAEFAHQIRRPDLAVWVARNARNSGTPFYAREAYPQVQIPAAQRHYWSLAHGIIRQESSFDRAAVSHAGARGMMQLMPGTARSTAGKLGASYELGRLTRDPDYNIMLGSRYFAQLMDSWGGSTPLAVASYNAGPGNVRRWIAANGDPRMPGVDIVRWIEDIPFAETRGYVQRVLENAVVYDAINPAQARTPAMTRLSSYLGKSGRPG